MKLRTCRVGTCDRIIGWNEDRCSEHKVAQPSLFEADRAGDARRTDPVTSKKAAGSNLVARQSQKAKILARLAASPVPLTSHDVADLTSDQHGTASKRLGDLEKAGLIVRCGLEYPASGGSPRFRYRVTEDGMRDAALLGVAS